MMEMNATLQNRYRLLRVLGQGGMGTVYLAEDGRLGGRHVAIKELSLGHVAPSEREARLHAFRQEAMTLARLRHSGVASVSDFFFETGSAYLVMEYVPGQTLRQFLQQQPGRQLSSAQAVEFAQQLCGVLDYLHQQHPPLIFRDLKPENVMVQPDGQLKLIDFGIARLFKTGQQQDTVAMGTPGYASPEHYGQGQTDPRSDIYSLGIMLHEMVTGQDPAHRTPFTPLDWANLPANGRSPTLKAVILRATQLDVGLRYASMSEMQADLTFPSAARPPQRGAVWAVGLAALALLLLSGGGLFWAAGRQQEMPVVAPPTAAESMAVVVAGEETAVAPSPTETPSATPPPSPTPTTAPTETAEPPTPTPPPTPTLFDLEVSATAPRTETGTWVRAGQEVLVEYVGGSWRAGPSPTWPLVGPEGDPQVAAKSLFPVPTSPIMTLIVGVGEERPLPVDGVRLAFTASGDGFLWLGPNDDNVTDNAGSLTVRIHISD